MELYFLRDDFSLLDGPIDEFTSAVWREKYFDVGSFTVHFPKKLMSLALDAAYVCTYTDGNRSICGRIEYVSADEDGDCLMSGSLLEVLLSDRIMNGSGAFSGTVDTAVKSAVNANIRNSILSVEGSNLIDETAVLPYSWNNLAEWVYSVLKPYGASYTVKIDPATGKPVFRLVRGEDKTLDGNSAQKAVFSTSFGNIASIRLQKNTGEAKNVVYVKGKDDTVVTVDKSNGAEKREIYVTANDIAPSGFYTTSEYTSALSKRGEEILAKYPEGFWVNAECAVDSIPKYGKDFFIGDICDVSDEDLGLSFGMRLTAVDTVWENGVLTVFPIFGEEISYVKKLTGK